MLKLNLVKAVLWCALRTSTLLEALYSLLGSIIAACDEHIWRHHAKMQTKRWQDWMDEHGRDEQCYEGKAEMFNAPTLHELMHEMMNIPVFDPDLKGIKSSLHDLLK